MKTASAKPYCGDYNQTETYTPLLTLRQRALYGVGGAVFSVKEAAYSIFVLIFYTQVLGLAGSIAGLVMLLAILWDAVNDPLIGGWSDRFQSRWGRRHPFMLAGAIPMGIGFIGLFYPPAAITEDTWLLAAWLLFWSLWIRTFLSFFSIPHLAMAAELTTDYYERSRLLGARTFFGFICAVALPALALLVLFPTINEIDGRFVAGNYPMYGLWSCLLVWLVAGLAIGGTPRHPGERKVAAKKNASPTTVTALFKDFALILRNLNFRNILFYDAAASASYGILISLNVLAWTYYWELSTTQLSVVLALPSIIGVPLAVWAMGPLGKRWSKHRILQLTIGLMIAVAMSVYLLRWLDWLPANDHPLVFVALLLQMLAWMFLFVIRVICAFSIIADVTDEHELEHGTRQEGGFFAAMGFTTKLAGAAGPLYAGIVLDVINLQEGMLPGAIAQQTLDGLALSLLVGVIPLLLLAWRFTYAISMSPQKLAHIQAQLRAREEQKN
ncbi:MFS transporter [Candidatus Litorirhabdus singularis]|uniref:MFS transporter n=1 Tax=Candidatus Litorirhabdus singularis TaxID=2518993 RepID=UPI00242E3AD8|nr:MFS transporter [Candidatus Litorirhabdus singularis]